MAERANSPAHIVLASFRPPVHLPKRDTGDIDECIYVSWNLAKKRGGGVQAAAISSFRLEGSAIGLPDLAANFAYGYISKSTAGAASVYHQYVYESTFGKSTFSKLHPLQAEPAQRTEPHKQRETTPARTRCKCRRQQGMIPGYLGQDSQVLRRNDSPPTPEEVH